MSLEGKRPFKFWIIIGMSFSLMLAYLLATAPEPLVGSEEVNFAMSTEEALTLLAHENDVTRTLYTRAIVGKGKEHGLQFSEDWQHQEVIAGPLPALFLRGVADYLTSSDVPLGLYLGSDFPIESSNRFQGKQAEEFKKMRADGKPKIFRDEVLGETIGMYPDLATAKACVSCHNDHENTTKSDWVLGDLMGATTWSYPGDSVTTDEFLSMLLAYRSGVAEVWESYLKEVEQLEEEERPEVGEKWPSTGFNLPNASVFQDSVASQSSPYLVNELTKLIDSN